jgi:exodeoxyribonuclease V alpha subunit
MLTPVAAPAEDVAVHGRVAHLFYQSPKFSAGVLQSDGLGRVKFSGKFMVATGDEVNLLGRWTEHPQYGRQFSAVGMLHVLPMDPQGLARYLATDPAFTGIGPERARVIAEGFGGSFDAVIRETPDRVADAAHLPTSVVQRLRAAWIARAEMNALSAWLGSFGLTHRQITQLVTKLGQNAVALLERNPYELCQLIPGFGFARADEIAMKLGIAKTHPARVAAVFDQLLYKAEHDGHCWMEEDALLQAAFKALCLDTLDAHAVISERLNALVDTGELFRRDGGGRWIIAHPELTERERMIRDRLLAATQLPVDDTLDWEAILAFVAPSLNPSQRTAALMACRHAVSCIAGAAGSGKSYTIAAIYRAVSQVWEDVALVAPTGKAAKRLEELCRTEAKTIHRLLEFNTVSWGRNAETPLEAAVVIVDEVSMCDVRLFSQLLLAIDFTHTKLILVGDPNQLPSVGPGNVLRDLLSQRLLPITVLDQVVRQAGVLKDNCTAMLRGEVRETADGVSGVLRPWYLITDCASEAMLLQTLETLVTESLPRLGIDPVLQTQILTPANKGPLGTRALNLLLQRVLQAHRYGVTVEPVAEHRRPLLYPGDKVMQTRNNYDLELMNGAIGCVRDIVTVEEHPGRPIEMLDLQFDQRRLMLPRHDEAADDLQLAYASTVHKCQGSEFPVVIAVVHRAHAFMLNRNLLYTAVTRAQQSAIILGDRTGLRRAIGNRSVEGRRTFLGLGAWSDEKGDV